MIVPKGNPDESRKQARYLLSIACLVKDAEIHDRLQQEVKRLTGSYDLRQLSHEQLDLSD
jgi:hypothetical protein